jgi:hypothetical protein
LPTASTHPVKASGNSTVLAQNRENRLALVSFDRAK